MSLIHPYLRQYFTRQRDVHPGQDFLKYFPGAQFMGRVEKRPQIRDRNSIDPGCAQHCGCRAHVLFHQGSEDPAVGVNSLRYCQGQRPFDQDRWRRQFQVIALSRLHPAPQGQQVAEPPGCDKTGIGAGAGKDRIGGDRGAVDDCLHPGKEILQFNPVVLRGLFQCGKYTPAGVGRRS